MCDLSLCTADVHFIAGTASYISTTFTLQLLVSRRTGRRLRERCFSGALRGGPGRGTSSFEHVVSFTRVAPPTQVVSAEQSFHRRLAEYEMRLDLFRKFSGDFRGDLRMNFRVFAKVARWVLHQRDWGAAGVVQRNIEQQKLFREDSSTAHFRWLRNKSRKGWKRNWSQTNSHQTTQCIH